MITTAFWGLSVCDGNPQVIALSLLKYIQIGCFLHKDRENLWKIQKKQLRSIYLSLFQVREQEWKLLIHPLNILQEGFPHIQAPGIVDEHLRRFATSKILDNKKNLRENSSGTESYACNDDETMHLNGGWSLFIRRT